MFQKSFGTEIYYFFRSAGSRFASLCDRTCVWPWKKCLLKCKTRRHWIYTNSSVREKCWKYIEFKLASSPPSLKFSKLHRYNKKLRILDSLQNFELFYYFNQFLRYVNWSRLFTNAYNFRIVMNASLKWNWVEKLRICILFFKNNVI